MSKIKNVSPKKQKSKSHPGIAGRKKLKDPSVHLNIYVRKSVVKEFGSSIKAIEFAKAKLEEEATRRREHKTKAPLIITDLT